MNPAPYIFWFTIGASSLAQAKAVSWGAVILFVVVCYCLLVGSKAVLAIVVGNNRHFLATTYYRRIIQLLGLVLAGFAVFYLISGLKIIING